MEEFMKIAFEEAKKAEREGEVPIGSAIFLNGKLISKAHNLRERKKRSTAHAEILAIEKACKKLKSWRLEQCEIYVTLEPCLMCLGAIINSRIKKLVFGAFDSKSETKTFLRSKDNSLNHNLIVEGGVMQEECSNLLKNFFKQAREN